MFVLFAGKTMRLLAIRAVVVFTKPQTNRKNKLNSLWTLLFLIWNYNIDYIKERIQWFWHRIRGYKTKWNAIGISNSKEHDFWAMRFFFCFYHKIMRIFVWMGFFVCDVCKFLRRCKNANHTNVRKFAKEKQNTF